MIIKNVMEIVIKLIVETSFNANSYFKSFVVFIKIYKIVFCKQHFILNMC